MNKRAECQIYIYKEVYKIVYIFMICSMLTYFNSLSRAKCHLPKVFFTEDDT